MPQRIVKLVYDFQEMLDGEADNVFSSKAVDKAREWLLLAVTDPDWYEYVFELWKSALAEIGFEDAEFQFSGFWSQGDGASFTATVDLPKLTTFLATKIVPSESIGLADGKEVFGSYVVHRIGGKPPPNPEYTRFTSAWTVASVSVERDTHRYSHKNTCSVHSDGIYLDNDGCSGTQAVWEDFLGDVETLRKDLCQAIYTMLEEGYEATTSDESLAETAEINGWTFDQSGTRDGDLEPREHQTIVEEEPVSKKRKLLLRSSLRQLR